MSNNNLINKLVAKTENQKEYIRSIKKETLTFCTGPAGSGKSCIPVALGLEELVKDNYEKLIIIRPQLEAREKVGFPPGTAEEKYSLYLSHIDEELTKWTDAKTLKRLNDQKKIQKTQIAYCRGMTFNDAFVIVDEAQNITYHQFKLLLTRIGQNCKMIISGDIRQSDLYNEKKYSFEMVLKKLQAASIEGIGFVELTIDDIVRSDIVGQIIKVLETE